MHRIIQPYFQEIVFTKSLRPYSIEALVRFRGQKELSRGLMNQWVRSGYITQVDHAMLRCIRQHLEQRSNSSIRTTVNIAASTIAANVDDSLDRLVDLAPWTRRLVVDITPPSQPVSWDAIVEFARQARFSGIHVAIDGWEPGGEFACEDFLLAARPRFIKISGGFVDACFKAGTAAPIRTLQRFAAESRSILIAKGIDSQAKSDFVTKIGVKLQQGWLFSVPAPDYPAKTAQESTY